MNQKYILLLTNLFVFTALLQRGHGHLTVKPVTTEALVGEGAHFNCSTSLKDSEIQWFYYPVGQSSDRQLVYGYKEFAPNYRTHFRMEIINSTKAFNLVIPSVKVDDAGRYECQDDYGRGDKAQAELLVIETVPVCSSGKDLNKVTGGNNCGIKPDQLLFSCITQYKGNEPPVMKWRKVGDEDTVDNPLPMEKLDSKVISNMTIAGDKVKTGDSFECIATRTSTTKTRCQTQNVTIISKNVVFEECSCRMYIDAIVCIIIIPFIIGGIVFGILYLYVFQNQKKLENGIIVKKQEKHLDLIFCINFIPFFIGAVLSFVWYWRIYRPKVKQSQLAEAKSQQEMEKSQHNSVDADGSETSHDKQEGEKLVPQDNNPPVISYKVAEDNKSTDLLVQLQQLKKQRESEKREHKETQRKLSNLSNEIDELKNRNLELEQHLYPPDHADYSEKPSLAHVIKTEAGVQDQLPINGLAVLGNSLFVLHEKSSDIEVYDSATYVFNHKITIPKLTEPMDLVPSRMKSSLFLIGRFEPEKNSSRIQRIETNGKVLNDWESGGNSGRLSTYEFKVIVCLLERLIIQEFTHEGTPIHTVRLSPADGFKNLWHAIKVTSMHFAVSHGEGKGELQRVCVVNFDGKIIKACVEMKKAKASSHPTFNVPICLLEDKKRSIIVAERENERIILLDSTLKYRGKLINDDKNLETITRISFDDTGSRLFVSVYKSSEKKFKCGQVLVYNLK